MLFFEYYTKYIHRQPNTKCLLHLLRRGQYILYIIIMYYRSPCLFFRNTVRSASSCFRVRQDHYGARGLWPDHVCARGLWLDHPCARGLTRPLRALGPSGTRQTNPCSGTLGDSPDHSVLWDFWPDHSVLGDCLDHSPTTARGLRRSLLDP